MRKYSVYFILLFSVLSFVSCKKKNLEANNCFKNTSSNELKTISFKSGYIIQIPHEFIGGMTGFEGNIFHVHSANKEVFLKYNYCKLNYCLDFGEKLENPVVESITILAKNDFDTSIQTIEKLDKKYLFCSNDSKIWGMFFHNDSCGRLYMLNGEDYLEALDINIYDANYLNFDKIVKEYITTIKKID